MRLQYWPLDKVIAELTRYNVRHVNDITESGTGTATTEFIESALVYLNTLRGIREYTGLDVSPDTHIRRNKDGNSSL